MTGDEHPSLHRRIVICNWRDSGHPQSGGAELYCEEVARRLRDDGHQVTLLTARAPGQLPDELTDYGRVVRLGGTYSTYVRVLLWLLLHRSQVDGVLDSANGIPFFSPLAVSPSTPVALLLHHVHQDQFALYLPAPLAALGRFLEKWASRWVYGHRPVCVVSPSVRTEVRRRLVFRGPIVITPNGTTPAVTPKRQERSARPTIVSVGRLVPHKRLRLLVDAVPSLLERWPDLEVHIVGDGEQRAPLQAQAEALRLDGAVTFHGRLSAPARDALMDGAWLTVNPSVGEGWGLSVIEAAAQGVPAVAFRVPGLRDSVRPESTGWLIDDGADVGAAVDAALRTLSDPGEARSFAERCQDWAASFSWEATAQRLNAVLESEHDRLSLGLHERRAHSDVATILAFPRAALPKGALVAIRRHDQVRESGEDLEILLEGADDRDALRVLERAGIPPESAHRIRVARHRDLLGWGPRPTLDADPSLDHDAAKVVSFHPRARRATGA